MSDDTAEKLLAALEGALAREKYLIAGFTIMHETLSIIAISDNSLSPKLLAQECIEQLNKHPFPSHASQPHR